MSPKMSAVLDPATGHGAAEKARKEAHGKATTAAMEVEKDAVTPCPLDVQQLCRNKKQDEFEKKYNIAPGCGYYRRRYENFLARNPKLTPPTYYLEYGEKYCNKFTRETYAELTSEGREWLDGVKCGLQQGIEDMLQDPEKMYLEYLETDFTEAAFDMHAPTYLANGLADLDVSDIVKIGWTAKEEFIPFRGDYLGPTYKQAKDVFWPVLKGRTAENTLPDWMLFKNTK